MIHAITILAIPATHVTRVLISSMAKRKQTCKDRGGRVQKISDALLEVGMMFYLMNSYDIFCVSKSRSLSRHHIHSTRIPFIAMDFQGCDSSKDILRDK